MLVDLSGEWPRMIIKVILQGALDLIIRKNRRTIYSSVWLLHMSRLLEAVHNLFELIFRALGGSILFRVHGLEESMVLIIHIIWAACAVFYGRRKADVRGRLRVRERVELVILQGALNSIGSGDVYLSDLTTDDGCLGSGESSLQVVFLLGWSRVGVYGLRSAYILFRLFYATVEA